MPAGQADFLLFPDCKSSTEQQIIAVAVGKVPAAEGGRENFWETQDTIVDFLVSRTKSVDGFLL